MANEQNLIDGGRAHKLTVEEQSRGGKRSGEVRAAKRDLKLAIDILLEKEYTDKKGTTKSGAELIAFKQYEKALQGDTRAFEVIRDTAGQKPVEKIMMAEVEQSVIDEVERMVTGDD